MEQQVLLSRVFVKDTSKGPMWIVVDDKDKEYATKKADIGEQAKTLMMQSQPAVLTFTEVQKGDYTNRYLDGVRPGHNGQPAPAAQQSFSSPAPTSKDVMIWRMTASKVAHQYIPEGERTFQNLVIMSERIVEYYIHGASVLKDDIPF